MPAIMFDFDGTITQGSPNIWKEIWIDLGYDTGQGSYYSKLFLGFLLKEFDHQTWCDLTCEKYMEKGLTQDRFNEIVKKTNIKPIMGLENTFKALKQRGYQIHIVSGNFDTVINNFLKENGVDKYVDSVNANKMIFDKEGNCRKIKGTNYDFEGKAEFINQFKARTGMSPYNICFVGNGDNDEWAHLSGCKTICVNPKGTDHTDRTKWHHGIEKVYNLQQILPYVMDMELKLPAVKMEPSNIIIRPNYAVTVRPNYALVPRKDMPIIERKPMPVSVKQQMPIQVIKTKEDGGMSR